LESEEGGGVWFGLSLTLSVDLNQGVE